MHHFNRQSTKYMAPAVALMIALMTAGLPSTSHADEWELRTTRKEVPGTREIESGDVQKAIRISLVHLDRVRSRHRVAVLNNLCIGYILIRDFDQASQYCDQAVSMPKERVVSLNNRGVLRALQGDYAEARGDFALAWELGCNGPCDAAAPAPLNLPHHVALRNYDRTDPEMLASELEMNEGLFLIRKQR